MSPVEMPFRYSHGNAADTRWERRTNGGTSAELNLMPATRAVAHFRHPYFDIADRREYLARRQIAIPHHRPLPTQHLYVAVLGQQFLNLDLDRLLDQFPRPAPNQFLQRQPHLPGEVLLSPSELPRNLNRAFPLEIPYNIGHRVLRRNADAYVRSRPSGALRLSSIPCASPIRGNTSPRCRRSTPNTRFLRRLGENQVVFAAPSRMTQPLVLFHRESMASDRIHNKISWLGLVVVGGVSVGAISVSN